MRIPLDQAARVYNSISEDRILAEAAGITYYALLAIFPAIAALVSIYGMFADPAEIARAMGNLEQIPITWNHIQRLGSSRDNPVT